MKTRNFDVFTSSDRVKARDDIRSLVLVGVFIAIMAVLTITNVGIITVNVVSITILHIPVIIASLTLGPSYGGITGLAFGIMSMLNATFRGATPADLMFTPFGPANKPIQSIILCIGPRILLGILPFFIYIGLKKLFKKEHLSVAVSAGLSSALHTIMVLSLLYFLFFKDMSFAEVLKTVFLAVIGINGVVEMCAAILLCTAITIPLKRFVIKK
ncbi:MAG: ECF transporter S component [Lachnospiraceae bacterium]|jgi:uncharacterized membrane protein|nr:ECF transporter S component [Lachnospiraceae bacterium]